MKLLVTGGMGFIGSNLALELEKLGHAVSIVDHSESRKKFMQKNFSGEMIKADISDPKFRENLTGHFDAIFHQAACTDTTVMDEKFMRKNNVEAFKNLLAWAESSGTDVIYASSAATYGNSPAPQTVGVGENPMNIYGISKLEMDNIVRGKKDSKPLQKESSHQVSQINGTSQKSPDEAEGIFQRFQPKIKIIGLRYFNVYGPGESHKNHMASMIYKLGKEMKQGRRPKIFFDGNQKRDQIYVKDVIQANLCALKSPKTSSGIYNVGTGKAVTFNEIIAALNKKMGTKLETEYFKNPYSFFQNHTEADISLTTANLGYKPRYDLEKGIEEYLESGELGELRIDN